jgi:hypothetical protein
MLFPTPVKPGFLNYGNNNEIASCMEAATQKTTNNTVRGYRVKQNIDAPDCGCRCFLPKERDTALNEVSIDSSADC